METDQDERMKDYTDYSLLPHNTFGIDARCRRFIDDGRRSRGIAVGEETRGRRGNERGGKQGTGFSCHSTLFLRHGRRGGRHHRPAAESYVYTIPNLPVDWQAGTLHEKIFGGTLAPFFEATDGISWRHVLRTDGRCMAVACEDARGYVSSEQLETLRL